MERERSRERDGEIYQRGRRSGHGDLAGGEAPGRRRGGGAPGLDAAAVGHRWACTVWGKERD